ncbi:sensor histidine kinase [Radiobacillus kanasensis]|uniref:sensor histidine kinase n=1 Tax=Radiobacillus kanasensis TaxID=2844358 RepID=UPI001E556329|nr:sensor histidine kinase [Radiobacillus kanasensis]UFT98758.1 sensor histidine kinase [Radiobacillus kanasensis]
MPIRLSFYRNLKIKDKIFSVSLVLLLIFCLIGIVTYHYFTSVYEKRIFQESAEMLKVSSTIIDKELRKMEKLSFQISTDELIQDYLVTIKENTYNYSVYQSKMKLADRLLTFSNTEHYISSIQIVDAMNNSFLSGYNTDMRSRIEGIYLEVLDAQGANIWSKIKEQNGISSARLIRRKENLSLEHLGVLTIGIHMERFIDEILNFSSYKNFVIANRNQIFYQTGEQMWDMKDLSLANYENGYTITKINGKDYFVSYIPSRYSSFVYYNILPFENITKQSRMIRNIMIVCFLFMLSVTLLLSRRAAQNISKPIEKLMGKMKHVQNGNFDESEIHIERYYNDEVGQLHQDFRTMLAKINELIRENYQKQLVIKETEYKALQAQINPHFLYNTLDSMNWLAKMNHQDKISKMAEALGNMMRNIISKKSPLITVKDELEIVNNYIIIQKYRYENRLDFSLESTVDYDRSQIPKLTIQPLVENAIQHCLEQLVANCYVHVHITSYQEDLEITVEDNGPGMDEQTIHSIYNGMVKSKGTGIGIYNINERIKLMFGPEYGIDIESEVGIGTKIKIKLPFVKR